MSFEIKPFYYNETSLDDDGVTHIIGKQKLVYTLSYHKTFWDCETEDEVRKMVIKELVVLRKQLENELNKRLLFKERRIKK